MYFLTWGIDRAVSMMRGQILASALLRAQRMMGSEPGIVLTR